MLRQPGPVSSTPRPLDLTVHRDGSKSSLYPVQRSSSLTLTWSAVLQAPSNVLRHDLGPSRFSEDDLRFRPYSFGPVRSLEDTQAYRSTVEQEYRFRGRIEEESEYRSVMELPWRYPVLVNSCWTQPGTDHGQLMKIFIRHTMVALNNRKKMLKSLSKQSL